MRGKEKATFPFMMTIVSFFAFIFVFSIVTFRSVNPYYLTGLIFAIPSVCFGTITILSLKKKLSSATSSIITGVLIPIFVIVMFFVLLFMIFDSVTSITTDIKRYETALATTGYPNNVLTKSFPKQVPKNSSNVKFHYNPAFLQGGEDLVLQFKTDSESIANYKAEFSEQANEFTNSKMTLPDYDYAQGSFSLLGYNQVPSGYVCYLLYAKPYLTDSWNHGEYSFVAINYELDTVIFAESDW